MRIIFKKRLIDELHGRIVEGKRNRREVEYILLTNAEYAQLRAEVGHNEFIPEGMHLCPTTENMLNPNMPCIELEDPRWQRAPVCRYMRFARQGQFQGYDVYVVPDRFIQ